MQIKGSKVCNMSQSSKNMVILRDREEIVDFRRESKDLRTDFTEKVS